MGLFDSLFGSHASGLSGNVSESQTVQTGTQNAATTGTNVSNQTQTSAQQQTGTTTSDTTTAQNTAENSLISTLDPHTQALLTSLLPQLTANASAGTAGGDANVTGAQTIAGNLYQKATVGDAATQAASTAADIQAAKLAYETGEGQQVAGVKQQIGSADNTYSQLIQNKGANDLATQLAQITSRGQLAASGQESSDLSAALQAISGASSIASTDVNTAIQPLLNFAAALKGANTTSQNLTTSAGGTSTVGITQQNTLNDLISAITSANTSNTDTTSTAGAITDTSASATSSSSATPGIIQTLFSL